jgi:hypothetical protein
MPGPNTSPIFTLVPNVGFARLAAANTARDGSGTITTIFTGGTNGSLLNKITFTSAQATAAASALKVMRIFITDTSGGNPRLRGEILLPAVTASNTVIGAAATFTFTDGLILRSGQLVQVAQSIFAGPADQTDCIAEGGDY